MLTNDVNTVRVWMLVGVKPGQGNIRRSNMVGNGNKMGQMLAMAVARSDQGSLLGERFGHGGLDK